ncbi:MAG: hypothetical protein ABI609_13525 [Acidobacteriota bacterium]
MARIVRLSQRAAMLAVVLLGPGCLATPARGTPPTWMTRFGQAARDVYASPAHIEGHGQNIKDPIRGSHAVAVDGLGNVYVAGSATPDSFDHQDFLVTKYDASGNVVWYRTTDGGARLEDTAFCLALSADAVFVTGETCTDSNCDPDFLTVKYDATSGAQLWAKTADGPGHDWDESPCVAVDSSGNPFVAGTTSNPGPPGNLRDILAIKYNGATGAELWRKDKSTSTSNSNDVATAIAVGPDGHPVVTGWDSDGLLTVKFDSANGNELWSDASLAFAEGRAVAIDSGNNAIVVGIADNALDNKFLIVKYGPSGGVVWQKAVNYGVGTTETARDVVVDGAGDVYVTGPLKLFNALTFFTAKYRASDGVEQWSHNFGTGVLDDDYVPTGIATSASGRVFVTGYRGKPGSYDFFTESLNATSGSSGPIQATRNGTGLGDDNAVGVAVDASGNAVVVGLSKGTVNADFLVVKYNAALTEQWAQREPLLDSDEVLGSLMPPELGRKKIALDSLGNTVVVGSTAFAASAPGATGTDFLVQKYGPGGNLVWSRTIDGGFGDDFAVAVAIDNGNNIYVTGWSIGSGTGYDMLTLRLDPTTAATVWAQRYDGAAHQDDVAYSLVLGRDGALGSQDTVFVGGASFDGAKFQATVVAYHTAGGGSPWAAAPSAGGGDAFAYALAYGCTDTFGAQCVATGVYLTGQATNAFSPTSGSDFLVGLLDAASGSPVWVSTLFPAGQEVGLAIAAAGQPARVAVAGRQDGNWLTAVFQGGSPTQLWTAVKDFDGRDDQAFDVALDSVRDVVVTGFATKLPARNKQVAVVKYAGTLGVELAVSRFGPIDEDLTGYGVATDFAGDVFVVGTRFSLTSQKNDFMFIKYSTGLGIVDSDFLDSNAGDDHGWSLVVEKNSGDAVVAGTTYGTSAAGDFLLAKYRSPAQGDFFTVPPCRLYDSRNDPAGPISGGQTRVISALGFVGSCPLLTPTIRSLAFNVTVVSPTASGFLQLYPGNLGVPATSAISFAAGKTRANNGVLSLATNAAGTFTIRSGLPSGQTVHVIVDLAGYFD